MKLFKPPIIFIGFLVAFLQAVTAQSEEVKMYNQPPSAEEMGRIIFGGRPKMRSINFGKKLTPKADTGSAVPEQEKIESMTHVIGLPIKFAYNSDEILEDSVPFLQEVGRMLTLEEYLNKRLVIEGHTDAVGSDQYNKVLSKRRANKVKHFLRKNFHIAASRLLTKGLGESKPLPGYDPEDEVNRRVQFYSI